MNIFEPFYDPSDLSACVPASQSAAGLNAMAAADGIYFPLWRDPGQALGELYLNSRACSRSFRFGLVGDNVMGSRFRLAGGQALDLGGRVVKNVVGLDLLRFFAGHGGSLGGPETLVLRLRPLPELRQEWRLSGDTAALQDFLRHFFASPWLHSVDALDLEVDGRGARLGLAYACGRAEGPLILDALRGLAQGVDFSEAPLPRHSVRPARELQLPLSQCLPQALALQSAHGGRVSGFLGQGSLLLEPESPLPPLPPPANADLEASLARLLGLVA